MKIPFGWILDHVELDVTPQQLGEDLTNVGLALDGLEGSGDRAVLDLDVTTNRVDCMNVRGVAREAAVIYRRDMRPLATEFSELPSDGGHVPLTVEIAAADLCGRFAARVIDVTMGPPPEWMRSRLEAAGVRSISNIVDVTNYVMLELGQPTHAFDITRVPGGRLVARWAHAGERLTTLDGTERELDPGIGVVAGSSGPLALAGIMGGASSEVSDATRTIALEAAYWEPMAIRKAARRLGIHTEASHRFERHADPEAPVLAIARIAHLVEKIGAGRIRAGAIDVNASGRPRRRVVVRQARIDGVLGVAVPPDDVRRVLDGLGFEAAPGGGDGRDLAIPTWRNDVSREVDVIEEIGRHFGLGRIPACLPPADAAAGLTVAQRRERRLRDLLVGAGFAEVINLSFVSNWEGSAEDVRLLNPLSEDQGVLRRGLVLPGLLENLATNVRQGSRDLALFEIGRVFAKTDGLPLEPRRLGLLASGRFGPGHWSATCRAADVFDLKGVLETLAGRLGARLDFGTDGDLPAHLHPGQAARVLLGERQIGWVGVLHPELLRARELREVVVAEIDLDPLLLAEETATRYVSLVRFPAVDRDVSALCPATMTAASMVETVQAAGGALLRSVQITSRFEGPPVPEGFVSLTVGLRFQDASRTLTSDEVVCAVDSIIGALRECGAEIRGE